MLFQAMRETPDFVQCPCDVCDGLVGTKPNMVEGRSGWYCCEESRERFDRQVARPRVRMAAEMESGQLQRAS
jgi:hypothetical protein